VESQQLHVEAQASELVDQALGARLRIQALEVVFAEVVVGLAARNDVIDDHAERRGQRDERLRVSTPGGDAPVASGQCGVLGVRRCLRGLDEEGAQPRVALAGAPTARSSRALIPRAHPARSSRALIPRAHSDPAPTLPRQRARR